ncbi:MAG: VTT domain-containing protein, partial [Deltaproteobacteria bacterium]|nr:VTT domain-containing protein [Deltaproteobacteria bacterium]
SLHSPEGLEQLIAAGGLLVLFIIIFSETGLLAGFFLPGDSLLVTAGLLASRSMNGGAPILNIFTLNLVLILAAVMGDQVGFWLGRKTGPRIFNRPDNRFFKKKYALEAQAFYERHGGKAIILARFVPILRTFVPFVAGVAQMDYRRFVSFNIFGGIFWVLSMTLLGYFLGKSPLGEKLHLIILAVVFLSVLPMGVTLLKKVLGGKKIQVN